MFLKEKSAGEGIWTIVNV